MLRDAHTALGMTMLSRGKLNTWGCSYDSGLDHVEEGKLSSSTSSYSPDPIGGISATVYVADVTIHIILRQR